MTTIWTNLLISLQLKKGGVRGVRKLQNRTEIRQKTQTASDFFPNTETARPLRFQLRPRQPHLPLLRIESKKREHKAVQANISQVDASLAKTFNHIKY